MRRFASLNFVLSLAALLLSGGCSRPAPPDAPGGTYVQPATAPQQVAGGITLTYIASQPREQQIRAGYAKLTLGDSRERVRAIMGPPDLAFARYTRADEGHGYLGWGYIYIIRATQFQSTTADVNILLVFDPSTNKLRWTFPSESAQLIGLGTPGEPR